jgi:hypothetical protein
MSWISFDNGASIGQRGSENGIILRDEEHVDGARITLERDGHIAPFSITCGIYGWMVHTCFFATQEEAELEYERMKDELAKILDIIPFEDDPDLENKLDPVSDAISRFVEEHW